MPQPQSAAAAPLGQRAVAGLSLPCIYPHFPEQLQHWHHPVLDAGMWLWATQR